MVKRRSTRGRSRKSHSTRRLHSQYRYKGGGTVSCPSPEDTATNVNILEDMLKTASPSQTICYGDAITSCTTLTVVMEDGWKVGVHTNPISYGFHLKYGIGSMQIYNPETIVPVVKSILDTNVNFVGKKIKAIYVIGDSGKYVVQAYVDKKTKKQLPGFIPTNAKLNNINTSTLRPAVANVKNRSNVAQVSVELTQTNALEFFQTQFGAGRFVADPMIIINPKKTIQRKHNNHFIIKEDGTLDLV